MSALQKKKIPRIKSAPDNKKIAKTNLDPSLFYEISICWKIGSFDIEGSWGIKSIKGNIKFKFGDELLEEIASLEDEELYSCLDKLSSQEHSSLSSFFNKLQNDYKKGISPEIIKKIHASISQDFFITKILPKLSDFENRSWKEIEKDRYGSQNKTKHHNIDIDKIIPSAQKRLEEIGFGDESEIYSLRLEGKLRIFGFRKQNYLEIIWIDPEHEICPSFKK